MNIECRVTIDDMEVDYIIEYLQLVVDNPDIIEKEYPKEIGYKVIGHIMTIIEELKRDKK